MEEKKLITFAARCKAYFGMLPDQSLQDFAKELKDLTTEDKLEFWEAFNAMGLETARPAGL